MLSSIWKRGQVCESAVFRFPSTLILCNAGLGVVRNYNDKNVTSLHPMPYFYPFTVANDAQSLWNFANFRPDAVVINLGTNDYSTEPHPPTPTFIAGYIRLLTFIRSKYGSAPHIFLACGPMIGDPCCENVKSVAAQFADPAVHYVDLRFIILPEDIGCDGHPSVQGHTKMANLLIPQISKYLNWSEAP